MLILKKNWGAETFVAENSDAMEVIIEALDTIKYPDIDDDSHITNEVYDILQQGADEDDSSIVWMLYSRLLMFSIT